jgi:hypothetical protein
MALSRQRLLTDFTLAHLYLTDHSARSERFAAFLASRTTPASPRPGVRCTEAREVNSQPVLNSDNEPLGSRTNSRSAMDGPSPKVVLGRGSRCRGVGYR